MKLIKPGTQTVMNPADKRLILALLTNAYQVRVKLVRQFQAEHEQILTQLQELKEAEEVAANELRTAAKQHAMSFETDSVKVEYVMPKHRYLDPEIVETLVPEAIRKALGIIVTTKSVDEKVLKAVIKAGKVKESVLAKALVEEPTGSPRVTIFMRDTNNANQR
jgi:hypothetical protein